MKKVVKKSLTLLSTLLMLNAHAYAQTHGQILAPLLFPEQTQQQPELTPDGERLTPFEKISETSKLGPFKNQFSIRQIQDIYKLSESNMSFKDADTTIYSFKKEKIDKNTQLLTVFYNTAAEYTLPIEQLHQPQAIYIFQNGVNTGYSILETQAVYLPERYPLYQGIKNLPETILQNPITSPTGNHIRFYQANRADDYIERYALMQVNKNKQALESEDLAQNVVVLMAFYPRQLEHILQPRITKVLNHNANTYGAWLPTNN